MVEIAHDAEVEQGEAAVVGNQHVPLMWVAVEQPLHEDLVEDRVSELPRQERTVDAVELVQAIHPVSPHALQGEYVVAGEGPDHPRHEHEGPRLLLLPDSLHVVGLDGIDHLGLDLLRELPGELEKSRSCKGADWRCASWVRSEMT